MRMAVAVVESDRHGGELGADRAHPRHGAGGPAAVMGDLDDRRVEVARREHGELAAALDVTREEYRAPGVGEAQNQGRVVHRRADPFRRWMQNLEDVPEARRPMATREDERLDARGMHGLPETIPGLTATGHARPPEGAGTKVPNQIRHAPEVIRMRV
jgi:hypothetical protein